MITVDTTVCVGCRTCELVCSFSKTGRFQPSRSLIQITFDDQCACTWKLDPLCDSCFECVRRCPVHAIRPVRDGDLPNGM